MRLKIETLSLADGDWIGRCYKSEHFWVDMRIFHRVANMGQLTYCEARDGRSKGPTRGMVFPDRNLSQLLEVFEWGLAQPQRTRSATLHIDGSPLGCRASGGCLLLHPKDDRLALDPDPADDAPPEHGQCYAPREIVEQMAADLRCWIACSRWPATLDPRLATRPAETLSLPEQITRVRAGAK